MATDLEKLVELQSLDNELARLNERLDRVPQDLARIEAQLASAQRRVDEARTALKNGEAARRRREQEIQSLNEQIAKFRSQSSSVKNNEQYKALLAEIAHGESEIASIEEKILEIMLAADTLTAQLKEAEAALKVESAVIERQKSEVEQAAAIDRAAAQIAAAKVAQQRSGLDEGVLTLYDRIRKSRGNAVAEVLDGRCSVCQVALRPQMVSVLRSASDFVHCDICGRILHYVPEHNKKVAAANTSGISHQAERQWMFVPSLGTQGAFAVFINHKGTATMKAYDAKSGEVIARRVEKNAVCASIFADELREARNLFVDEADLDEKYKDQLPDEVLDELQHQLPD